MRAAARESRREWRRSRMKILITGNLGYVGPWVTRQLRARYPDASLIGVDIGYFAHCLTDACRVPEALLDAQYYADIRRLPPELLDGVDAVVHLAAISNDPMGNAFEDVTFDVNYRAGIELARQAKAAGVRSFVFASSCSVYGSADDQPRTERSEVAPLTAYAKSKVLTEQGLRGARRARFPRVLPAVRDRVRDERPVAPGSRAERLRRLRHLDWSDHRAQRRHAVAAADQREGHGARD